MEKEVAIVLGGTSAHIALIKNLQRRGYYVILADYLKNPPAKEYADKHILASTLDQNEILEIAKENDAKLVISACVDQANITACYVMEQMGLTVPYSYETALSITNKGEMKKRMFEYGVPTSKYVYVEKNTDLESLELPEFPLMVKPADCNSSSGVKKASNIEEMRTYLEDALKYSRNSRAVIESFVEGIEVSVYAFIKDKRARIIMISQRMSVIEGEQQVLKCYATLAPAPISDAAIQKLENAATKIAEAFQLDNTPLHVQALINGDDIDIIEFAPRVGGGISYKTIFENTGFDIIDATIDSYLNHPVEINAHAPECFYTVNLVYAWPGIYDHMEGQEKLIRDGIIEGMYYHKTPGMQIGDERAASARVGAFLIKADTLEELKVKTKTAIERLEVYSDSGEKIMRKELSILRDLK